MISPTVAKLPYTHHDYPVAWICALPLEMAAAKMMLDRLHPSLPQPESDHNAYTLGSISGHNVVVACLPSGVYGTTAAAVVLAHTLETFPSLRFGLMVGIGGGVPSNDTDIRLGDVVISMPTATSGGVVQYDYGKTLRGGRFERTGSLNKPPQYLLTAVSQIRSDALCGSTLTDENLLGVLQRHPNIQRFCRPDVDWLFQASYDHSSESADCSKCDQDRLVTRLSRETNGPKIHYGLIASGNQVMKDAVARDTIAQELNILCFEMEAAGLMDQLSCLVIRGICDYCDSHKHKKWQGYAALTAAAYTKALLRAVPMSSHTRNLYGKDRRHWMVPFARNTRFVGRQEEIRRLENFMSKPLGPNKIAIHGLGGIGKTQIALELAYRIRDKNPECSIFWIPCTNYESVEQTYLNIALTLGISNAESAKAKEQVKVHLSQASAGRWLLIFDNADDIEMWIKPEGSTNASPLKNILPYSESGHILFTSRNRRLAVKLAASNVLLVPDVDQSTAMEILEKSLIQINLSYENDAASTLLEQLSFLPLAISQAAAYINENDILISDYLSLLKQKEMSAAELLSEEFEDDGRYAEIQNPVITTWLISFVQIQQLDSLAADYLSFMACINPRDIPQSILPPTPSAKKRVDAFGLLKAYSFISEHSHEKKFSLHRLVHLAMRNWMRKEKIIDRWVSLAAERLNELFPDNDHSNRELWRDYLAHALYLTNSEESHHFYFEHVGFTSRVGILLQSDGRYKEANHLFARNLKIREEALGPEHPDTLTSVSHLGSVLERQGKYEEAEAMYRRALEGREKVLGPEYPDTLKSVSDLGFVLERRQDKYEEAEAMYRRALEGREKGLGPEHPNTLTSVSYLGSLLKRQGKYKEAEAMHRRALEGREKGLGPEHPGTLASVTNLGSVLERQGKYKEAEAMHQRVLEGYTKTLGPEHPYTLTSVSHLAFVFDRQGKYEETEAIHRQVFKGYTEALGPEHPYTIISVNNLGCVLKRQGKYEEAEAMYRRAFEGYKKALGPEHPDTLTMINNLGSVFERQGKYEEAEAMHRRALEGREKGLGPEHPDTLRGITNLSSVLERQGKYEEAEAMHRRALEGREKGLGPEHPDTLTSVTNLGSVLERQGKYEEAEAMHRRVLEGREKGLGPEHPDTLTSVKILTHLRKSLERMQYVSAISSKQALPILAPSQDRLKTAAQKFLEYHPLLGFPRSANAVPRPCDMNEVD
ncbi:Tetratricopeptide-like helical [Penicillium angulare]|uniref:Tetratricopeptide-like helical n=1 Tax=Penicillium angulare TaxID=116970 RepID=A0A9W9FJ13_9EURO|nr:Tetratricopeptide-like helical [Penicillium angulare]